MISLVIADDEERICRLITALGEWERLGICVKATAANGLEALDIIRRENVDLLITDIRMPGLGGMELIREVYEVSPQTRIIVISGYSNFEYAQTAIEYGVKGYLLKPINRQELNEILEKQVQEIGKERQYNRNIQLIREENEQAVRRSRERLVTDLCSNPSLSVTQQRLNDYYHFSFSGGSLFALVLKTCTPLSDIGTELQKVFQERTEEILAKQFKDAVEDMVTGWNTDFGICIISCRRLDADQIRRAARESLKRIQVMQEPIGTGGVSMGLGGPAADSTQLSLALDIARKGSWEHLLHGYGRVCLEDVSKETVSAGSLLDHFTRDISPALETMDMVQAADAVNALRRNVDQIRGIRSWEVLELVRQAGVMVLMRLEVSGQNELREEFYCALKRCSSEDDLFQTLIDFVSGQMETLAQLRQSDSNRAVRIAKQYIQQHYQEPLTLEEVAEHVNLTDAYFSVLFKKETGEGFAKYLASVRLDMAKRMLRETSLPVAEICRQVGYNDVKHFSRIFERNSGVTPAAYRKLYG